MYSPATQPHTHRTDGDTAAGQSDADPRADTGAGRAVRQPSDIRQHCRPDSGPSAAVSEPSLCRFWVSSLLSPVSSLWSALREVVSAFASWSC